MTLSVQIADLVTLSRFGKLTVLSVAQTSPRGSWGIFSGGPSRSYLGSLHLGSCFKVFCDGNPAFPTT